ncbi:MAG TPA: hypothetical protein PL037_09570, partial [Elusimicrobiales bacterium]|nr:hypothetical protein [Elusimicrobiales bacterium]
KADLKTFSAENYSGVIGGSLEGVLKGIEAVHAGGFWLEIVTLFIPGFNDSRKEMEEIAGYIAGLSRDIPWHVTAFHPAYRMTDRGATPASTLLAACEAGAEKGLKYVYAGNIPEAGRQDTLCAGCGAVLVRRRGFSVLEDRIEVSAEGRGSCPDCREAVPGLWK